jgi:predicted RecB family endonuclease
VRAGVVEVLALEVDLRAAHLAAGARGVVHGRGAADEVRQLVAEFGDELRVVLVRA